MKNANRSSRTLKQRLNGALSPIALVTTLCATALGSANAQVAISTPIPDTKSATNDIVIVTGTRAVGMTVADSPAPIQVLDAAVLQETGATDLMNAIATSTPSFNANQTGGDMASQTLTAQMRALSPNHALVLINGHRRHITSNVAAGSGAMAADMSHIPSSAIQRVEVLTDGAAALYGSDAIAGVFNVILKNNRSGGDLSVGYSGYGDGGGETTNIMGNYAFGGDNWFVDVGAETEDRETVNRAIQYSPALCVANQAACLAYNTTGYLKYGGTQYQNGTINSTYLPMVNGVVVNNDQNMVLNPEFPYMNHVGDPPELHRKEVMFNAGYDINDHFQLYAFGSAGEKHAKSAETYRRPSQDGGVDLDKDGSRYISTTASQTFANSDITNGVRELNVNKYLYGFTPYEESDERDYEVAVGAKGDIAEWRWDLATVYGRNKMDVFTTNSMNFSLWNRDGVSQTDFYDGTYWSSQWTTSGTLAREFNIGLKNPMTFATGGEYRIDKYGIKPGEPASYFGAGASSFPGYNPAVNTGSYDRNAYAGFVNVILKPLDAWSVDLAGRYENYSDFGDETVGKITSRYDITNWLAVRGTASTGFRAPTLGEEYYSAVNVSPTAANPQLQPNGTGAAALGFGGGLKPEKSTNYSAGLVFADLIPSLTVTVDAYEITIDDRILRGSLAFSQGQSANTRTGCPVTTVGRTCLGLVTDSNKPDPADTNGNGVPDDVYNAALGAALVSFGYIGNATDPSAPGGSLDPTARANISVSLFNNALSTQTRGVDLVANYATHFDWGRIDWTLSANYNDMEVLSAKPAPAILGGAKLYSDLTIRNMETSDPKYRVNLGARFTAGDFTVNVRETLYGPQYSLSSAASLPQIVKNQIEIVRFQNVDYYKSTDIKLMALMNLDITWKPSSDWRFTIGADNVFNQYPPKVQKAVWDYNTDSYRNTGTRQYMAGSPVGYFGRKLYAKISKSF